MNITLRFAQPEKDARRILAIYKPYIEKTAITFETEVPEEAAFEDRIQRIAEHFPYLVLEADGKMIGYAYAHRQAERAAFDWNAELSIYLKEGFTGKGLGRPLYTLLIRLLAMQGYVNLYAVITASNTSSIAMHKAMGFESVGMHVHTGFKLGCWHDTLWLCRRMHEGAPGKIMPVHALDAASIKESMEEAQSAIEKRWTDAFTSKEGLKA